ncbi:1,2-phenylacetyl-CoA epoxidase subunit PaaB [Rhodococcus sp. BH5]|uniref:1,2-phenylacetyl-CoA epoxidase subunit PaaB n=1 Tax=Rhodococcus sp. BH5 TaxID=2871702 RepID=UPI0022CD37E3|nr:1,2-phenylacetyl-CoA epoxidase subunit PaaB [Rhodococcus sp. BH5]MCZ9634922.1 1,2-phenylacetyl-CoA epoxidase subunit B [Rhodococcus sp. BH5]
MYPSWEVFVRPRRGLSHQHIGSVRAEDAEMALSNARNLYIRRLDAASIWVMRSDSIRASNPSEKEALFSGAVDKPFRYSNFYIDLNEEVNP